MTDSEAPLVSVLIRSMDRSTLDRALAAVAAQTYRPLEAVVVAACGPAHRALPEMIGSVPLRLIVPATRLQRSAAANACLDHAHGVWLNFLDDDDAMAPEHIQTLVATVNTAPPVRLAYTRAAVMDEQGQQSGVFGSAYLPWLRFECGFFQPGAALFARSLLDTGVRFDPDLDILEDMDFWLQCAHHTEFRFIDQASSHYYAESGTSGAGFGGNADAEKTARALSRLRSKWASEIAEVERSFDYLLHRGRDRLRRGQPDKAIVDLSAALRIKPGHVDALNVYGVCLLQTSAPAEALAVFDRALSSYPGQPQLLANRALALRALARG